MSIAYKETILAGLRAGKSICRIKEETVTRPGFNLESFRRAYRKVRQGNSGLPALTLQEKNRSNPQADPDWLAQERKDAKARLRGEINSMVNAHCKATGQPHRIAWATLYAEFESRTGFRLPHDDKLGWIAGIGWLPILYSIGKGLSDPDRLAEEAFLRGLEEELDKLDSSPGPDVGQQAPCAVAYKSVRHKNCGGDVIFTATAPLIWQRDVNDGLPFQCSDCERVDYKCSRCGAEWKGHPVQAPKPCKLLPDWEVVE